MLFKHFVEHFSEASSILVTFFKKFFFSQKIKLETLYTIKHYYVSIVFKIVTVLLKMYVK